jgi:2-(1,2-epoxy-1,2-dihydrophenyl)acetyl-CoA isomerase
MMLTNRRVGADEALAIGLVTRLVDDAQLASEGEAAALALAQGPTRALGATRALLAASLPSDLDAQLDREAAAIAQAGAGAECREGLTAFLAKRKPDFQGV